jgi:hypothetical protein
MRASSIPASATLAGRREQSRVRWRAALAAIRRCASSTEAARIQSRLDAVKAENERRYLQAGGRRW